jgi:deoxynucleoside triphosphate triphosphohydrolase SAMHD1
LADQMCKKAFESGGRKGLGLAERDYIHESLIIAGLCHDLGHGPFSHTFDSLVIPKITGSREWSHEQASEMLFDDMIDTYHIDMEAHQIKFIKGLIRGERACNYDIDWIYEVISSKKYGLDVDRFDYMMRDPLHTGQVDLVFRPSIYLDNFSIIENEMVYNGKICNKIFEFFNHRYKLFKNIYLNRKGIGFEYMVADLFSLVANDFKFAEAIYDPKMYLKLTNNIMDDIDKIGETRKDVRQMVNRFYHRQNYKFVNEIIFIKKSKKRHSEEELKKLKDLFLSLQKPGHSSATLTDENTILSASMTKYCEENQFDTIKVMDFDGQIKLASSFTNLMNVVDPYEYHVHLYVKDPGVYEVAKETWSSLIQGYSHLLKPE